MCVVRENFTICFCVWQMIDSPLGCDWQIHCGGCFTRVEQSEQRWLLCLASSAVPVCCSSSSLLADPTAALGVLSQETEAGGNVVNFTRAVHASSVLWD